MTDNQNLKEHNIKRLDIIKSKANVAQSEIKKEISSLTVYINNFLDNNVKYVIEELIPLDVNESLPVSKINENAFDKIIFKKDFNLSNNKVKGSFFKNFFCSLFTGIFVSVSILLYKFIDLKLITLNNISQYQEIFTKSNLDIVLDNLNKLIPSTIPLTSNIILGIISGLIFFILFSISEIIRKKNIRQMEEKIYEELEEYDLYIKNKLHTYADISKYIKRMFSLIESLSILFDEEKAKLRRINYMKDPNEKLDFKTVKDITRVVNLINKTKELLSVKINDQEELSYEANSILRETEDYIQKHIKKIYRSED